MKGKYVCPHCKKPSEQIMDVKLIEQIIGYMVGLKCAESVNDIVKEVLEEKKYSKQRETEERD